MDKNIIKLEYLEKYSNITINTCQELYSEYDRLIENNEENIYRKKILKEIIQNIRGDTKNIYIYPDYII